MILGVGIKEGIRVFSPLPSEGDHPLLSSRQPCHASNFPICCRLSNSQLLPHQISLPAPSSHRTIYELERSISQTPIAIVAPRLAGLLVWLQAIARLQRNNIAQRLRIQPSARQPNRQGESGICVELPTSLLIRHYPPPCLAHPRQYPITTGLDANRFGLAGY